MSRQIGPFGKGDRHGRAWLKLMSSVPIEGWDEAVGAAVGGCVSVGVGAVGGCGSLILAGRTTACPPGALAGVLLGVLRSVALKNLYALKIEPRPIQRRKK